MINPANSTVKLVEVCPGANGDLEYAHACPFGMCNEDARSEADTPSAEEVVVDLETEQSPSPRSS